MGDTTGPQWVLLEYDSTEILGRSILDRKQRLLFYPTVGQMKTGDMVDIHVSVGDSSVLFPMKSDVRAVRHRPLGPDKPRGILLEIIKADQSRFDNLCAFIDGLWRPAARRANIRYPASIRASYGVPPVSHPAETKDISLVGMFLRTEGPLPEPGKQITVKLYPYRLRPSLSLSAEVRWRDLIPGRHGMGLLVTGPKSSLDRLNSLVSKIIMSAKA